MPWGNALRAAIVVGFLGFVTSVATSVLLAFCIADALTCTIIGIVFSVCAVICFILAFALRSSSSLIRFLIFATAVLSLAASAILLLLEQDYHTTASYFNRATVYFYIVLAPSFVINFAWPLLTKYCMGAILRASKVDRGEELLFYLGGTFVAMFALAALFPAAYGVTTDELSSNALSWAVAAWFFAGIVSAAVGILIERRGDKGGAHGDYELQTATARVSRGPALRESIVEAT
jgi:hypothetical protein